MKASSVSAPFARRLPRRLRARPARRHALISERLETRLPLAVVTPFTVRYTTDAPGDITFAANTLMTAGSGTATQIADAQNGIGTKVNNNDFTMAYVDVDTDATTWNSSTSALVMPAGSQVLFAGLYWGARTNSTFATGKTSEQALVKFKAPGDAAYRDLTGTVIGTSSNSYQSFFDVTSIVQGAGAGSYTTANVRAVSQASDYYAGWSLVVAYRAPDAPVRNLTVFDGYGEVRSADPAVSITVNGFKAPTSGRRGVRWDSDRVFPDSAASSPGSAWGSCWRLFCLRPAAVRRPRTTRRCRSRSRRTKCRTSASR